MKNLKKYLKDLLKQLQKELEKGSTNELTVGYNIGKIELILYILKNF